MNSCMIVKMSMPSGKSNRSLKRWLSFALDHVTVSGSNTTVECICSKIFKECEWACGHNNNYYYRAAFCLNN